MRATIWRKLLLSVMLVSIFSLLSACGMDGDLCLPDKCPHKSVKDPQQTYF